MTTGLLDRELQTGRAIGQSRGGVWDYVSPSRLALWLKCPLAFELRYCKGERTPTSPAAFVGKMVHSALEAFYRHRQLGLTLDACDLTIRLGQNWAAAAAEEGVKFKDGDAQAKCWRQTLGLVATYLQELPADDPPPLAVETSVEAPLIDPATGDDLGLPLVGVLDLVLAGEKGPTIVDFKTASRGGELVAEIVHELQLTAYAYLLRVTSERTEAGLEIRQLVKTKAPQVLRHRFPARTARHFRRFFAVVRAYLADLRSGQFLFRPGLACASCEFRNRQCRTWED